MSRYHVVYRRGGPRSALHLELMTARSKAELEQFAAASVDDRGRPITIVKIHWLGNTREEEMTTDA